MSIGLLFWILMILWLVLGTWAAWPLTANNGRIFGTNFLLFVIIAILGWHSFGPVVHG